MKKSFTHSPLRQAIAGATLASSLMLSSFATASENSTSYLIQGNEVSVLKAAIVRVGGEVTHELDLINAVGAELTQSQYKILMQMKGLRLMNDQPVGIESAGSTETVRDEFTIKSYAENAGSTNWLGDWAEINDGGGAASGNVFVADRKGRLHLKRADRGVERAVYLPTNSQATLTLEAKRARLTSADQFMMVQVSDDGGINWHTLGEIAGPTNDSDLLPYSYDISTYATPDTMVRLFTSNGMNGDTKIWVDNVQIEYSSDSVSTEIVETFFDTFNSADFSGNNGTLTFLGDWQELNDDNHPANGHVKITDRLTIAESNNGAQRSADLSAGIGAKLSFDYKRVALDNENDYVTLEVSTDGTTWHQLDRLSGPDNGQRLPFYSI